MLRLALLWIALTVNLVITGEAKSLPSKATAHLIEYLLPEEHPLKAQLDAFFSQGRIIFNLETLEESGFENPRLRSFTHLVVTRHVAFPGYIFKLHLDTQRYPKDLPEYYFWQKRIQGARALQEAIDRAQYGHLFKVPKKWIYILPKEPRVPSGYATKHTILVEEDMQIWDYEKNHAMWKDLDLDVAFLKALAEVIQAAGLHDLKPANLPFAKDGRMAFIDTQAWDEKPDYKKLSSFLSESQKVYWEKLFSPNFP